MCLGKPSSSAVASSLFADSPTSAQPQMKSTLQRHDSVANFSYRVPSDDESSVDDRAEETCSLSEFAVLLNVAFWDENADGFEAGIKSFRLVAPNKKKFREPGNEGLLPPLPF